MGVLTSSIFKYRVEGLQILIRFRGAVGQDVVLGVVWMCVWVTARIFQFVLAGCCHCFKYYMCILPLDIYTHQRRWSSYNLNRFNKLRKWLIPFRNFMKFPFGVFIQSTCLHPHTSIGTRTVPHLFRTKLDMELEKAAAGVLSAWWLLISRCFAARVRTSRQKGAWCQLKLAHLSFSRRLGTCVSSRHTSSPWLLDQTYYSRRSNGSPDRTLNSN